MCLISLEKKQTLILINKQTKKKKKMETLNYNLEEEKKSIQLCTNYMGDEIANQKLKIPSLESQMKSATVKKREGTADDGNGREVRRDHEVEKGFRSQICKRRNNKQERIFTIQPILRFSFICYV